MQFWDDTIKNLEKTMATIDKSVSLSIGEQISLCDCKVWPKFYMNKDSIAHEQRICGNQSYAIQEFDVAIKQYNLVLRFSTSIEDKGISYANRAAAYLALGCYQDCLDSVHLAKQCPLPAKTMMKVLAREIIAEEYLKGCASGSELPDELSYRRHKRIPSFVFCIKLKDDSNPYGGIVTTENLLPGDILVKEAPLTTFARSIHNRCCNCLRNCGSLQPCDCGYVFYCSPKCKEESLFYHNFECPLWEHFVAFSNADCLVLRIFFKVIQRFKDVATLREYLENINTPNPFEGDDFELWPDAGSFESQFRLYYANERPFLTNCAVHKHNLFRTDLNNKNMNTCIAKAALVIDMLKSCKQVPCAAKSSDEWSFLSEQLFRLFFYKTFSTMGLITYDEIKYVQDANSERKMIFDESTSTNAISFHGTASLFRTSCEPNVIMDYGKRKNELIVRATKCIPRGAELLAPY